MVPGRVLAAMGLAWAVLAPGAAAGAAGAAKVPELKPGKEVVLAPRPADGKAVGWVTTSTGAQLVLRLEELTGREKLDPRRRDKQPGDILALAAQPRLVRKDFYTPQELDMGVLRQARPGARVEVGWCRGDAARPDPWVAAIRLLQDFPPKGTVAGRALKRNSRNSFDLELTAGPKGGEHLVGQPVTFTVPVVRVGKELRSSPAHLKLLEPLREGDLLEVGYTVGEWFLLDTLKVVGRAADGKPPAGDKPAPKPGPKPEPKAQPKPPPPPPPEPGTEKPPADEEDF